MNIREALEYIHSFSKFGSKLGLERMRLLLKKLNNPEKNLNFFHIAGTNGKGSTALFIERTLTSGGYKCGLYISPYVVEFRERIQIGGEYIPEDKLCYYVNQIKQITDSLSPEEMPTEFEVITAVAFLYFRDEKVDYCVLEVGLGGRGDATNVIESPLVSVITKIDLDHTEILGDTIEKITAEKCGIIKKNRPVVTTVSQSAESISKILEFCKKNNSDLTVSEKPTDIKITKSGTEFSLGGKGYKTAMLGYHQAYNAALAISALSVSGVKIKDSDIEKGLLAVMPARAEVINDTPFVLLDGGHNPAGAAALANLIYELNINSATAIIGMMADKDVESVIKTVAPYFINAVCVRVEGNPRSMKAEELAALSKGYIQNTLAAPDYDSAVKYAENLSNGGPIICLGSLYLAGDIREKLKKYFK